MSLSDGAPLQQILILGAGGHGRVIADIAARRYLGARVAFLDDLHPGAEIDGIPVLARLSDLARVLADWQGIHVGVIAGVGDNAARAHVVRATSGLLVAPKHIFISAVDPSAVVSSRVSIGEGTVVMANVTVNTGTWVGAHVILNTACSVDHDCRIGDYAHVSPGAHLAGTVSVGEGTHLGVGSSVIPGIDIGAWSVVGAGSAVVRNLPDRVVAHGVPARVRRELEESSRGG